MFIDGSRAVYSLDKVLKEKLSSLKEKGYFVLLGDYKGINLLIQNYYANAEYDNVVIYTNNDYVKYNIGGFKTVTINDGNIRQAMINGCDYGFMLWDGKSRTILDNIIRLLNADKSCVVYLPEKEKITLIHNLAELKNLIHWQCPVTTEQTLKSIIFKSGKQSKV